MDTDHKETQVLLPNSIDLQQPTKMPTPPEALEQAQHREVSPPLNHICDICHKGFRSGQALGGHKSMHFRESEAIITSATTSTSDPICCLVCGKNFLSKKSLFRHLRSHTGNLSPRAGYNSGNSSSTVSDEPTFDDGKCDGVDSGSRFDLSKTLPAGWSITRRRKRNALGTSASDCSGSDETAGNSGLDLSPKLELVTVDPKLEAEEFSGLVMLAQVCAEEASRRNLINNNQVYQNGQIEIRYVAIECKRRRLNDGYERRWSAADHYGYNCNDIDSDFRCKLCNKTFTSYQALGGHMSSHYRLKINSKDHDHAQFNFEQHNEQHSLLPQVVSTYSCNVCDKTFSGYQALGAHILSHCKDVNDNNTHNSAHNRVIKDNNVPEPRQVELHSCGVCNKEFTSYQALGGHKSSHTKYNNNNNMDRDQSNSDISTGGAEDKNERQKLYVTVPHQCEECKKTFPTGQALGGHKRLHWKGPTGATAKPSQQSSARRPLEFDLNEIPSMEDEDEINVPSVLLQL
ncbi:zinc finger protein 62 homolog isoform X1 [Rosa chinensis]|nr:zinc finger protein 62 homolog isoform X1 [Rosa chinensis]